MPAEDDGLPEGEDEDLAIRAVAEMFADFPANVGWKLVVNIGGQLPEQIEAMALARLMAVSG
jgi:hypothetical protein